MLDSRRPGLLAAIVGVSHERFSVGLSYNDSCSAAPTEDC